MKKLILVIAAVALFSVGSSAKGMFEKGTRVFKFGVGLNGNGTPVEVTYEKGVANDFLGVKGMVLGLGANMGYYGYKEDFNNLAGSFSWKYSDIILAGRAMAHYPLIKKLDTYAGIMLGYNVASANYSGPNAGSVQTPSVGGVVWGGLIGARYEFNNNWGAYIEVGKSTSYGNLGIAYKF